MSAYSQNSSSNNSGETNFFTPDTPDGSWQQFRCRACDLPKRIEKPPVVPMTKTLPCKRCESRQQHRADGGSDVISVIDLTTNPDVSPAEVMGYLGAGRAARTPVLEDRHDPDSTYVHLRPGDDNCTDCGDFISPENFPDEAPFIRLLANQKRRRGVTRCEPCFSEVGPDE